MRPRRPARSSTRPSLLSLTASATRVSLTTNGWTNFFRGLANDGVQGPAVANYLTNDPRITRRSASSTDDSAYGLGLADEVSQRPRRSRGHQLRGQVKTGDQDFSAAVQLINGAAPDAVFYAGYYAEAAPFVQQLRDAGVTAAFVSADGTNDPQFVAAGRRRVQGRHPVLPVRPGAGRVSPPTYEEVNGQAPGVYSVEGYDLTTIMLIGHRLGHHRTCRAGRLRQELRRSGSGPQLQVGRHRRAGGVADLDLQGPVAVP